MSPRTKKTAPNALVDELLHMIVVYRSDGQDERAEGIKDALDKFRTWMDGGGAIPLRPKIQGFATPGDDWRPRVEALEESVKDIAAILRMEPARLSTEVQPEKKPEKKAPAPPSPLPTPKPKPPEKAESTAAPGAVGSGEMGTLKATAQLHELYGQPVHPDTIQAIVGLSDRTIRNHMVVLRREGLIETQGGQHKPTEQGKQAARTIPKWSLGEARLDEWLDVLPASEGHLLTQVAGHDVAVAVSTLGWGALSSRTIRNLVVSLVGKGLLRRQSHGMVYLAPVLRDQSP